MRPIMIVVLSEQVPSLNFAEVVSLASPVSLISYHHEHGDSERGGVRHGSHVSIVRILTVLL